MVCIISFPSDVLVELLNVSCVGTCYCEKKNFGNWYCEMSPRWYHGNGRGASYKGDRHPQHDDEHSPEDYEDQPRKCNNCGEVALMFKN